MKNKRTKEPKKAQQLYVWEKALECLDRLERRITPANRRRIEASLAAQIGIPKPTRR